MIPIDYNQIRINQLWEDLISAAPERIAQNSLAVYKDGCFFLPFLDQEYVFDLAKKKFTPASKDFFLSWVILAYLTCSKNTPLEKKWVSEKELKDGVFFFKGPHQLYVEPIIKKYGYNNKENFLKRGSALKGEKIAGYGDAAVVIPVLPRVPLLYVLWQGDDEFPPNVKILFDHTITNHFGLDTIWGLVHLVSKYF